MPITEAVTSSEGPELLKAMEDKIVTQSQEVTQEVKRVEAEVRTSIFGIPLPGVVFKPGMEIDELMAIRDSAANDNDPSLIKEKAA